MKQKFNQSNIIFDIVHINKTLLYNKKYLFDNKPISKFFGTHIREHDDYYSQLNKNGYRCDNFINNHDGLHLLFSGCSVSYGSGLEINEVWTNKVFTAVNKIKSCSGYFNLSFPGTGLINQIVDIFKYCSLYSKPNYIIINIPDLTRFYYYNDEYSEIGDAFYNLKDNNYSIIQLLYYQYYLMLYEYCKSNNIRLITFTWAETQLESEIFKKCNISNFDTFYYFNKKNMENFILEYVKNNKNDKYALKARDKDHFGTAYHEYWAQQIISIIISDIV